jgi:hypothetical protein
MHPDNQNTIRQHVVGRRLSGVTFVMDYVQLQFDPPPTINSMTPITVRSGGRMAVSGDEPFRNLLCEQIPKTVTDVSLVDGESLTFSFEDGSTVSLSLRREDYSACQEAVNVCGRDHLFIVI